MGLWGTDAEQIVYAVYQAFAMANSKNAPTRFGLQDFMMYYGVQQEASQPKKVRVSDVDPFYSFAAQIKSFGNAQVRSR